MRRIALLVVMLPFLIATFAAAQHSSVPASERKIATRIPPMYPELAKKTRMHGIVKIEAVVRSDGSVKSTRVLGGNPVLVDAAVEAVGKCKFERAQAETTEIIQVSFDPQ